MGANMFVSRGVFTAAGGFDQDLGPGGELITGEDCELAYRALRRGFPVSQDPTLELVHWGARPTRGGVARQLVITAFFAIGAGYGKHLRDGDWHAGAIILRESCLVALTIVRFALQRRHPLQAQRLWSFWRGVCAGLRRGSRKAVPALPPAD
jgi:hypothetical protein